MNTICNIPVNTEDITGSHLLMEIGDSGISMVWMNADKNFLLGAIVYSFSENEDTVVSLENIFHSRNIFNNKPATVTICYNYKESLLLPERYSKNENTSEMLSLVFGGREEAIIKNDKAPSSEITTIYRIPEAVNKTLNKHFPQAVIRHSSTFQLASNESDSLKAILFYDTVKIILHRKGKLHFVQQLAYERPEDVSYLLLNTCRQHDCNPEEIQLLLSGMIVEDSNLYKHLYNYFLHITFIPVPSHIEKREEIDSLPSHFFSHLIDLSLCAS